VTKVKKVTKVRAPTKKKSETQNQAKEARDDENTVMGRLLEKFEGGVCEVCREEHPTTPSCYCSCYTCANLLHLVEKADGFLEENVENINKMSEHNSNKADAMMEVKHEKNDNIQDVKREKEDTEKNFMNTVIKKEETLNEQIEIKEWVKMESIEEEYGENIPIYLKLRLKKEEKTGD